MNSQTPIIDRHAFHRITGISSKDGDVVSVEVARSLEVKLNEANRRLELAKNAVDANHKWHIDYDEYDGYADSELCEMNAAVLSILNQSKGDEK